MNQRSRSRRPLSLTEELERGVIGTSWSQIVFPAVLPSSIAYVASWIFNRFEINLAVAVAVGAATGAVTIGSEFGMAAAFWFGIQEIG